MYVAALATRAILAILTILAAVVDEGFRFPCGTQPAYLIAAPFRA
jgi:hypothetical protein